SEEHTSELQSLTNLVCRLLLEKKNIIAMMRIIMLIGTTKNREPLSSDLSSTTERASALPPPHTIYVTSLWRGRHIDAVPARARSPVASATTHICLGHDSSVTSAHIRRPDIRALPPHQRHPDALPRS